MTGQPFWDYEYCICNFVEWTECNIIYNTWYRLYYRQARASLSSLDKSSSSPILGPTGLPPYPWPQPHKKGAIFFKVLWLGKLAQADTFGMNFAIVR